VKYKYIILLFSLIIFFSSSLIAQIPGLINYSEEEGLNTSYTYRLRQDKDGFIWIGSDNGLFRFDGKEFKQYGKKDGLKNIDVLSCEPLPNGELLIISFLNDFASLKHGKVINSDQNRELQKLHFEHNPLISGTKETLYLCNVINPKNIFLYNNGKIKNLLLNHTSNKTSAKIQTIGMDTNKNILYIKNEKNEIEAYNFITRKKINCHISLGKSDITYKKDNFLINKHHNKIDVYKIEHTSRFTKIHTFYIREDIHQIIVDKNNKLWLCLDKGGVLYFDQPLSIEKHLTSPLRFLEDYIINDILVDTDNNVWFSTRNNGIFFITNSFLKNYISLPLRNNTAFITAITASKQDIILGYNKSESGIFHANTITDISLEPNKKTEHKAIFAKNNLIIFGLTKSIFKYDLITGKKKLLKPYGLKNILPYSGDSLLLCASNGLIVYNFIKDSYSDYLSDERVYTALPYHKDSLFVGNFKDLYKFNINTKTKTLFLEGYYFKDIQRLRSNLYAAGTNLNGIILFNNKKVLRKITEKDGLLSGQVKKITVENENVFWASTNSGINRIELKENRIFISSFTQTDGLPSNVVAGCVIRKDTLYAGTSKGLAILPINKLLSQQKFINKKVIINSVLIGDKEYFEPDQNLVGLSSNNEEVIVRLSFPDYSSQGKISYKYRIAGLIDNWQISNSSSIILNAVPPGKYTLQIFGLGYNGKQSDTSTDVIFEIQPRFWQTWWFRLLLSVLGISVILTGLNIYFQKKRNKKLETLYYEKKIAELELQAIKAQINPHFIYNCLNSIQFLLYKKNYSETENYLDIFSQMIRKTLYYSEKTFMPIKDEIEYLSLYLKMEKLRLKDQFSYQITASEAVNNKWTIPSLLIQPFVENAIKHGISGLKNRKGKVDISFEYHAPYLCITITDNGIGIGSNSESLKKDDSFGVKLSKKRIETFRQLFEVDIILEIEDLKEKQSLSGTQIKLYIPPHEN